MPKVQTSERLKTAALELFSQHGFANTSIAAIEKAAGLAPRAGTFYRHFESKQALFEELARERVTETPDEFDFEGLQDLADTRAELIAIARRYEVASERQRPYLRLIEEVRLSDFGRAFEADANAVMLNALMDWVATKPKGRSLKKGQLAALTMSVFGGWLFYLTKRQQDVQPGDLARNEMLATWAQFWSDALD